MEFCEKEYVKLNDQLNEVLKKNLNDILFIELNKDIMLNDTINIQKDVPLPIRSQYMVDGIKNSKYIENIKLDDIITSIIYLLGCDTEFKYKDSYINVIKNLDKKLMSIHLKNAVQYIESKRFSDAIIYFRAFNLFFPDNREISYNIPLTLKEWASTVEKYNENEYEKYYKLSFYEFIRLTEKYPDFSLAYYHLGFFYCNEHEYEKACDVWRKAYELTEDDENRRELSELVESTQDEIIFEKGRKEVIDGNVVGGLRNLIPLTQKYDDWSEAKYFTALAYRKSGNFRKAELLLNELLVSGERFPEIYNELGLCYYNLGFVDKAIEFLKNAVDLKSDDPGFLCNLAVAYYSIGEINKAREYITRAYEINPDDDVTTMCKNLVESCL